jgi:arylformamidase
MSHEWVDVTIPMGTGMTIWPGDPLFNFDPVARIASGSTCNLTLMTLSTHTGTHCDAPWHFDDGGKKLDELDPSVFFGRALLIDLRNVETIRAADLPAAPLPPRVLFRTRNSDVPANAPFDTRFVAVEADAAARLVADGVRMVGVDGLSVAPYKRSDETHRILLGAGVFVVEGLRLERFEAGECECVVLPMRLTGADGAPCRAFMRGMD